MKKRFNDTGTCIPAKHYMVDIKKKLDKTIKLIEYGDYFIINRPRQYGKTTIISLLEEILKKNDEYLPISISFEGIGDSEFESQKEFCPFFLKYLADEFHIRKLGLSKIFESKIDENLINFRALSNAITDIIMELDKKVVLLIDEVDKSSNNQLFLHFLGMLRDKYLKANQGKDLSFHSVILAGLHDVKTLKLKLRPNEQASYNSPWNIAADYNIDMTFDVDEIESMLKQYQNETKTEMKTNEIAKELRFYTSGYPYFVSKLCKIIDEEICPEKWEEKHIVEAIKILLLAENNTNFDSLTKNLENKKELYDLIVKLLIGNGDFPYEASTPLISYGKQHGIFSRTENNKLKIHNKIYEEKLYNYIIAKNATEGDSFNLVQSTYLKANGKLDLKKLLLKFQEAIKEKYSKTDLLKSKEFLEENLRMQFFMFLKPIVNGTGFSFKEVQTSEEKRLDVIVLFKDEKFIIELKMWRGNEYHKQGIEQIKDYMRRESVDKGYMIVMNKNKTKQFTSSEENGLFTIWL